MTLIRLVRVDGTDIMKELQDAGSCCDHEQRRQTEEKDRENQFDAYFPGSFLSLLTPSDAQVVRLGTESLGDAGAETVGLDEQCD